MLKRLVEKFLGEKDIVPLTEQELNQIRFRNADNDDVHKLLDEIELLKCTLAHYNE